MMKPSILKAILVFALFSVTYFIHGQAKPLRSPEKISTPKEKPFKVLTNGNQITIQANQDLKSLMVWTASGHRIVELKEMNLTRHTFTVPQKEKIIFLLMELSDGKRYTEKIGIR